VNATVKPKGKRSTKKVFRKGHKEAQREGKEETSRSGIAVI
jgi:hypothetical protein